uniref:Tr-type G domain-containing protein n=1 Tax=viral metagenome TaxID=1070528 RepID=A0A6C0E8U5_9ZZZZ
MLETTDPIDELYYIDPENDLGGIEYKLIINSKRLEGLQTQMLFRLREGQGQAMYRLGIMDDGLVVGLIEEHFKESFSNLEKMALNLDAEVKILTKNNVGRTLKGLEKYLQNPYFRNIVGFDEKTEESYEDRFAADIEVKFNTDYQYQSITIGMAGNVDSGKSTLLGVLTSGELDDGKGFARASIANHRHEIDTGNTSSRSYHIMGYDKSGKVVDFSRADTWEEIIDHSQKIIRFCDLAGHEKYFKTTIKGIASKPNYVIIMIEAGRGMTDMTRQHIITCGVYKVPFIIVISKVDQAPKERYQTTIDEIENYLKTKYNLYPYRINNKQEAIQASKEMLQYDQHMKVRHRLIPILSISNVTGEGLDLLKMLCYMLPPNREYETGADTKLYIHKIRNVRGNGKIIIGDLANGRLKVSQEVLVGPTSTGQYHKRVIKSIRINRVDVNEVEAGHQCSISLRHHPDDVNDSMVILNISNKPPPVVKQFGARIQILTNTPARDINNVTVRKGSEIHLTVNNLNKSAKVIKILEKNGVPLDDDNNIEIKMHDRALVLLEFYNSHYLEINDLFSFRQAYIYGVGNITALNSDDFTRTP